MRFTKMQGLGNDYIFIDASRERVDDPAALSRAISDRHFGAGSDGLVLILPDPEADFCMRMFNADGSEAEMCGNAARCVAKYVYEKGLTSKTEISLQTGGGIKILKLETDNGRVVSVEVDMGAPAFRPDRIPVALPENKAMSCPPRRPVSVSADAGKGHGNQMLPDRLDDAVFAYPVRIEDRTFEINCVSMGNPHAVIFVDDADHFDVHHYGPLLECHPIFPARANIEFVTVLDRNHLRMRVWERGSGETLACGTGACASLAAAAATGRSGREAVLHLNGGDLAIRWDAASGHIFQKGPAEFVYEADWPEK